MESGTMILLTILTIALVLVLVGVLIVGLLKIIRALEAIGGGERAYMGENMLDQLSLLAKARWGLRAIERQTAVIEPQVVKLNAGLGAIDAGLASVEASLADIVAALEGQGGSR